MSGYQVRRQSALNGTYVVERCIPCINGLSAWFTVCVVHEADETEMGYTDGAFGSALDRANAIANALNGTPKAHTLPLIPPTSPSSSP